MVIQRGRSVARIEFPIHKRFPAFDTRLLQLVRRKEGPTERSLKEAGQSTLVQFRGARPCIRRASRKAKRHLWSLIRRRGPAQTVLLTTHSMEEAEALCDRLAIQALGTRSCGGVVRLWRVLGRRATRATRRQVVVGWTEGWKWLLEARSSTNMVALAARRGIQIWGLGPVWRSSARRSGLDV